MVEDLETIYNDYFTPIYKYVFFRVHDEDLSMDIAQTVFLKVFSKKESLEQKTLLRYLYTVTRNTLIDHFRKKSTVHVENPEIFFNHVIDNNAPHAESLLQTREASEIVMKLLDLLDDHEKDIIIMRYIQEIDTKTISIIMDEREDNIRQIASRAIKKLRTHYEKIS